MGRYTDSEYCTVNPVFERHLGATLEIATEEAITSDEAQLSAEEMAPIPGLTQILIAVLKSPGQQHLRSSLAKLGSMRSLVNSIDEIMTEDLVRKPSI